MAKTVLYFDPARAAAPARRLTLPDAVASAFVRAGVAAAADPADAGTLASGSPLSAATPTDIVLEHGQPGVTRATRVTVPLAAAQAAAIAGVAAGVIGPISGSIAAPSFTSPPSISTDGSPQVDEIAGLDFGILANGVMGTKRLLRLNGSSYDDYVDASSGSIQWTAAGTYKLRVTVQGSALYSDSIAVVVAAATGEDYTPVPTLAFPAYRPDGTTAYNPASNPPSILFGIPETLDKSQAQLLIDFDQASSGAMSTANRFTIANLMAAADAEEFVTASFAGLAAGSFRVEAHFYYPTPAQHGPASARLVQTLNAIALPPATTILNTATPAGRSQYAYVTETATGNADWRVVRGEPSLGAIACSTSLGTRTDARFWEWTVVARNADESSNQVLFGVTFATGNMPNFESNLTTASGKAITVAIPNAAAAPVGTKFTVYATPATTTGGTANNDGILKLWKDGVLVSQTTHSYPEYRTLIGLRRGDQFRFNPGQDAFSYANVVPAGVNRFN